MTPEPHSVLARRFLPPLVLVVVGAVVLAVADAAGAVAGGMVVAGIGLIWLVSAAFFTVGHSEDVDRRRRPRG